MGELRQGALEGSVVEACRRGGGSSRREGSAGADARGRSGDRGRGGDRRGRGRSRSVPAHRPSPRVPDARADGGRHRRRARTDPPGRRRVEARWRPPPGPHRRGRGARVRSNARRRDRSRARGRGDDVGSALRAAILDGEAIAPRPDGRPHPFQVTGSRFASRTDVERQRDTTPLSPFFFDILHLNGEDLIDRPASERLRILREQPPSRSAFPTRSPRTPRPPNGSSTTPSRTVTRG